MANKGNNRHVKRLASGNYLKLHRKASAYVAKPASGRHSGSSSISLSTVLIEKLALAENAREARYAIKNGLVKVNGKAVSEERYPVGFSDVISVPDGGDSYLVGVGKRGAFSIEKLEKGMEVPFKVIGKYLARGGKQMIRLHNGRILAHSGDAKVNDSILLDAGKTGKVIRMEEGAKCYVLNGAHASESGTIKGIKPGSALRSPIVEIEGSSGSFETSMENIIAVSK